MAGMYVKKIAIFGGAFNPIHNGHIHLALALDARIKFDQILLIPSHISPHKDSHDLIEPEYRLAMCQLVAERYEKFVVSDIEIRREGKSFTIDTVRQLKAQFPQDKFYLIVGSDMFLTLDSWYHADDLLHMITVCAAAREKGEYERMIKKQLELDTRRIQSVVCAIEEVPVSSTLIRERLQNGQSVEEYLPDYLIQYIQEHRLYQSAAAKRQE